MLTRRLTLSVLVAVGLGTLFAGPAAPGADHRGDRLARWQVTRWQNVRGCCGYRGTCCPGGWTSPIPWQAVYPGRSPAKLFYAGSGLVWACPPYETRPLPYFAQFPVVTMNTVDSVSAGFWGRYLYRSDLARYGDQWDAQAKWASLGLAEAIRRGQVVPQGLTYQDVARRGRITRPAAEEIEASKPQPVLVRNPFVEDEEPQSPPVGNFGPPAARIQTLTSARVPPLRITNPYVE